ncbi:hypothetical protein A8C32_03855 [Flavivirga aquatica]|uniref:Uncharacterized protein n=1 Tax=Flavivirga aquatica TaxID=1849968 RepID=A0A1E5TB39_9FLAO|nr:hypothetical protein [Flavivirga aquatica]OEK08594.1 hypothetical protein A8C32_03855 [Flavivirga aquatica]
MKKIFTVDFFYEKYGITKNTVKIIVITPVVITALMMVVLLIPSTSKMGFWLLDENKPIEILTFIVFILAGFYGLNLSIKLFKFKKLFPALLYFIFSFCLIFLAMEEIAWGQWFFHFETPDSWKEINLRNETTIHNIDGIQGNTEILRLIYGVSGLIGIWFYRFYKFKDVYVPIILLPWFIVIIFHGSIDFYADIVSVGNRADLILQESSELIELLIAISSFIYLWLNSKMLKKDVFIPIVN